MVVSSPWNKHGWILIRYSVQVTQSAKVDIAQKKRYILYTFKYREYAEKYSTRIKKAIEDLSVFPKRHSQVGIRYRGYELYMKSDNYSNLVFYIIDEEYSRVSVIRVLQDDMDWRRILTEWISDK